jgi:hypothetical protein
VFSVPTANIVAMTFLTLFYFAYQIVGRGAKFQYFTLEIGHIIVDIDFD